MKRLQVLDGRHTPISTIADGRIVTYLVRFWMKYEYPVMTLYIQQLAIIRILCFELPTVSQNTTRWSNLLLQAGQSGHDVRMPLDLSVSPMTGITPQCPIE